MTIAPNLLVSISAPPKAGKTHLALTFPEPIKVFSFDGGAKFIAETKFADKKIDICEVTLPIIETENQAWALEPWRAFLKEYKGDVELGKYNTIVLDTATVVWQMCHQAVTEEREKQKLAEVKYYEPNLRMSSLFSRASLAGINLVTIQYITEKYEDNKATGEMKIDGWKRTGGAADLLLEMESITRGKGGASKTIMETTIVGCRFDRDLVGKTFTDTTYQEILALLGV